MSATETYAAAKEKRTEHARHIADLVADGRAVSPQWVAAYIETIDAEQAAKFAALSAERDDMALTLFERAVAS